MSEPPPTPPGLLHDSSLPQSPLTVAIDDGTESSGPPSSINLKETNMFQVAPISQVDPRSLEYLANRLRNQMPSGSGQAEGQAAPFKMDDVAVTVRSILVDSQAEDLHNFMNAMVVGPQRTSEPGTSSQANGSSDMLTLLGKFLPIPGPSEPYKALATPPIQPIASKRPSDVSNPSTSTLAKRDQPGSSNQASRQPDLPGPSSQLQTALSRSSDPSASTLAEMDQPELTTAEISASSQPPNASTDGSESPPKIRDKKDVSRTSERPKAQRSTKKRSSPGQSSSDKLGSTVKQSLTSEPSQPASGPSGISLNEFKRCYPITIKVPRRNLKQKIEEVGTSKQLEEQEEQGSKPKKQKKAMVETEYMVWTKDKEKRRGSTKQIKRPIDEFHYKFPDGFVKNVKFFKGVPMGEKRDLSGYSVEKLFEEWSRSEIQDSEKAGDTQGTSGANDSDQKVFQMSQLNETVKRAISNQGRHSSKERWEPVAELVKKDYPIHLPLENGENLVDFVAKNGSMPLLTLLLDRGAFPTTQLSTPIESIVEEHVDQVAIAIEKAIPDVYPHLKIGNEPEDLKAMLKSFASIPVGTIGHVQKEVDVQLREGQKFGLMVAPMVIKEMGFESTEDTELELAFNGERLQPKFAAFFEATPLQGPNRLELELPRASGNFLIVVPVWFTENV
ncbi:Protein CBG26515 [Caenorhabditis briggsae]|uniref:Protein CBG26515 n=1 Tax=Caenorhabditis briggsae TaxID=6238 RepID=B6IIZ8_CAEBR|nr:Protein CBG26515 [Caenorhabditis briggsae]CAR99878.1 Protein CBG26515 [Caenorhabditis briggsae]